MDKEQAEIYIKKSLIMQREESKNIQFKFLLVNVIFFGIAIALYQGIIFAIIITAIIAIDVMFTVIYVFKKRNYFNFMFLLALQILIFCLILNCIVFGLAIITKKFVFWEFLISIVIQLLAFIVSFVMVKKLSNNYKEKKENEKVKIIAVTFASCGYCIALILCRVFSPSILIGVAIISILINMLVCLFSIVIMAGFYKMYLIKKFKLDI